MDKLQLQKNFLCFKHHQEARDRVFLQKEAKEEDLFLKDQVVSFKPMVPKKHSHSQITSSIPYMNKFLHDMEINKGHLGSWFKDKATRSYSSRLEQRD